MATITTRTCDRCGYEQGSHPDLRAHICGTIEALTQDHITPMCPGSTKDLCGRCMPQLVALIDRFMRELYTRADTE